MNFEEFKEQYEHGKRGLQTVVTRENKAVAILSNIDNLKDCIEQDLDGTIVSFIGFSIYDYGYIGEVEVLVDMDGDEFEYTFELYAVGVY
jgi:hypothetical protein